MDSNHQINMWFIFSRRIKNDEARDCPLPPDGIPCPSVPTLVPSITEKIDLELRRRVQSVSHGGSQLLWSINYTRSRRRRISSTSHCRWPFLYACWIYLGRNKTVRQMLGLIDSMIGGHWMMKLQCVAIQWSTALPRPVTFLGKNELLLPTTCAKHCLLYLAYAKLFSLNQFTSCKLMHPKSFKID
jgi:hypothetical protein